MSKVSFAAKAATPSVASTPTPAAPAPATPVAPVAAITPPAPTAAAPAAPAPAQSDTVTMTVTETDGTVAQQPVAPPPAFYDGEAEEGFDAGDMVLPRLNIVQKVGELSNVYPGGTLILNGQLILAEAGKELQPGKPISIVVLGMQPTAYAEKIEGGARGKYFRTQGEVVAAGGTLDWNENKATKKPLYQRVAIALIAIEQPAGLDPTSFTYAIDGKNYAVALYTMKGIAYTNAARHIKSARKMGHLRTTGYRHGVWTLQSQLKQYTGNVYAYAPVLKPAGETSEAFRTQVEALLGF